MKNTAQRTICFKKNLTPLYIQNLRSETDMQISDAGITGLQLRYSATTMRKMYYLWYRVPGTKQQRHLRIGSSELFSLSEARQKAVDYKKQVLEGEDPFILIREKAKNRAEKEARRKRVKELAPIFLEKHSKVNNRESTYKNYEGYFRNHLLPLIGEKFIEDLDLPIIQDTYDKIKGYATPSLCDHITRLISSFLNWCEKYNYRTINTNPCHLLTKAKQTKFKPTLLDLNGYSKLFIALDDIQQMEVYSPVAILAIKALALTGCRCSEIKELEHDELDLENGFLHLNKRKTDSFDVPLGEPAIEVLKQAIAICKSRRYVFPSPQDRDRPIVDLRRAFWAALDKADLPQMRIHDLRHSFATLATTLGEDIRALKDVLGHTRITTTEIYAHATNKVAQKVANNVATAIKVAARAEGKEEAEI